MSTVKKIPCLCMIAAGAAAAQQQVEIRGHYDNAVGTSDAASQGVINAELLKSRPALRPGEVLEFVPGVIVTQHSGDGKANQYFLRGFNLDHGTDFATSVNGMPVNMPTHGHGQGYTDLNFLIPELVQRIEYRKGPYFAAAGDFSSAGSADILYRTTWDAPFAQITLGENALRRGVFGGSTDAGPLRLSATLELTRNDGPWTVPEDLKKDNAVLGVSGGSAAEGWSATLMGYRARWTATDQVPEPLIDEGLIGRFDSLDPTTGGTTARSSLSAQWHRIADGSATRVSAYAMRYRLDLYSNFTYALERPDEGDQFAQRDARRVAGLRATHAFGHRIAGLEARSEFGLTLRHDRIRVGLFQTQARQVLRTTREDHVRQTMAGAWGQASVELQPWLRVIAGLRADHWRANVQGLGDAAQSGRAADHQISPKLALVAGPFAKTEFFVNVGRGLHSNDARGTTDPQAPVPPLAAQTGWELGLRTEALPGLQSSLALWGLKSASELVYVGDAGATEASAGSRRRGVEWNNRWTPVPWFLLDADLAWTHARFDNGDRIPNAVDRVASVAATLRELRGWSASLQWRYLGSGALVEDNSQRARPSLTTNLRLAYAFGPRVEASLDVFNLTDREVNDIQYFYESDPPFKDAGAYRHVHPAEPRTARVTLRLGF